jgi:Holliday junction resolvase RusA-like endonuclease
VITQFSIPLPPTLNEQINQARSHWTKSARTKDQWSAAVARAASGSHQFSADVWITLDFVLQRYTSRDWDNTVASAKFILDGLKDAGTIADDSFSVVQAVTPFFRPAVKVGRKLEEECVTVTVSDRPLREIIRFPVVVGAAIPQTIRANSNIGGAA